VSGRAVHTDDELYEALCELGDTPDEVAAKLYEAGFKGERETGYSCPIAVYLNSAAAAFEACVEPEDVWLNSVNEFDHVRLHAVPPAAVADFILKFDGGEYPDLVRRARS
jgi:hypothetical protein